MSAIAMLMRCGARQAKMADDYEVPPTMRGAEVPDQGEYLAPVPDTPLGCEDVG